MVQAQAVFGGGTMKEILKIAIALTIACLIAGGVMGGVFIATAKAKKRNDQLNLQQTLFGLLGYGPNRSAPADLKVHTIYRYILADDGGTYSGYLMPAAGSPSDHELLIVDLNGKFIRRQELTLPPEKATDEQDRKQAIMEVLGPRTTANPADALMIAGTVAERRAYVVTGKFPGYKNAIHVMVALKPDFSILGLEITAHEEDPGLGGEIEKAYFKNQFRHKAFEEVKHLKVTTVPLAEEHRRFLEAEGAPARMLPETDAERSANKFQRDDIHAISGATISSAAVANGVRRLVRNAAQRISLLDQMIRENRIPAAF
jgi:electron transport complex protein RnfG